MQVQYSQKLCTILLIIGAEITFIVCFLIEDILRLPKDCNKRTMIFDDYSHKDAAIATLRECILLLPFNLR